MASNRCFVVSPWTGNGTTVNPYRSQLEDDYPCDIGDATGQPVSHITPSPNALVVQVLCDDPTLAAIEADATYTVLSEEALPDA